jgi:hypothetical protein
MIGLWQQKKSYDEGHLKLIYNEPTIKNYISHWCGYYFADNNMQHKIIHVAYTFIRHIIFCIAYEKLLIVLNSVHNGENPIIIDYDVVEELIVKFSWTYMIDTLGAIYSFKTNALTKLNKKFFVVTLIIVYFFKMINII